MDLSEVAERNAPLLDWLGFSGFAVQDAIDRAAETIREFVEIDCFQEVVAMPRNAVRASARPRQIVPTEGFHARGLAPVAGAQVPHLQNHGGPVIGAVEVAPIYWGAAWTAGANKQLTSKLDSFFDFLVTSSYMDLLSEYSTASTRIQHGSRLPSVRVSLSEPGDVTPTGRRVTDEQIRAALQTWIAERTAPATTENTLYFIFLPPKTVSESFGSQSCAAGGFCGYHDHIDNVYYAVIPFVNCQGCAFPGDILDTLTEVCSHEFAEAVTDPQLNAWFDPVTGPGDEIGDICNRQTTRLGGFLVQTEWSNAQNACAVAPALLVSQADDGEKKTRRAPAHSGRRAARAGS